MNRCTGKQVALVTLRHAGPGAEIRACHVVSDRRGGCVVTLDTRPKRTSGQPSFGGRIGLVSLGRDAIRRCVVLSREWRTSGNGDSRDVIGLQIRLMLGRKCPPGTSFDAGMMTGSRACVRENGAK